MSDTEDQFKVVSTLYNILWHADEYYKEDSLLLGFLDETIKFSGLFTELETEYPEQFYRGKCVVDGEDIKYLTILGVHLLYSSTVISCLDVLGWMYRDYKQKIESPEQSRP